MHKYEQVELHLTAHAWQQYCERVEDIQHVELQKNIRKQLKRGKYGYDRRNFIHLAGVWWVYELDHDMYFVTCYGRTSMDVPRALGWAARQNDRLDLSDLI